MANDSNNFSEIIAHCKEYGYIFPSSEIYEGLQAVYDYGPQGIALKRNIQELWWKTMTQTYSNNRGDNSYIPGAVIPGYIVIKPDFPECIDDFGFLWFEHEAVVAGAASWVVAGNAADAIIRERK